MVALLGCFGCFLPSFLLILDHLKFLVWYGSPENGARLSTSEYVPFGNTSAHLVYQIAPFLSEAPNGLGLPYLVYQSRPFLSEKLGATFGISNGNGPFGKCRTENMLRSFHRCGWPDVGMGICNLVGFTWGLFCNLMVFGYSWFCLVWFIWGFGCICG